MSDETTYTLEIDIPAADLDQMATLGWKLFGFKGTRAATGSRPLVWFSTTNYSQTTTCSWSENYSVYSSRSSLDDGVAVKASFSAPVTFGSKMTVNTSTLVGTLTEDGPSGEVEIDNESDGSFVGGLALPDPFTNESVPLVGIDIPMQTAANFMPYERVAIMFASESHDNGSVVFNSFTHGALILFDSKNTTRKVNFGLATGWTWSNAEWATKIARGENLAPLLIEPTV